MRTTIFLILTLWTSYVSAQVEKEEFNFEVRKIFNNLERLYQNDMEDKFGLPFEIKLNQNQSGKYLLNGSFPGVRVRKKSRRKNLSKITIEITTGNNFSLYSPLYILQIACHEIGHGVASGRKKNWFRILEKKIATEGESDFFVSECMMNYFRAYDVPESYKEKLGPIDRDVEEVCGRSSEYNECIMILQSAKYVGRQFDRYSKVSYLKTDTSRVDETLAGHPEAQCRLDTIRNSFFSKNRPRCWHHPIVPVLTKDLSMSFDFH